MYLVSILTSSWIQAVFTSGDARSLSGLTSKVLPLGSMFNFDADIKRTTARHQCENNFREGASALRPCTLQVNDVSIAWGTTAPSVSSLATQQAWN